MQTSLISMASRVNINLSVAKPFLKWAGGKGQLIGKLVDLFPVEMKTGEITKYAEPFIGGGALFFFVAQTYPSINYFFLSDINQELILTYKTIQKNVDELIDVLREKESEYHVKNRDEQKQYFYNTRDDFNNNLPNIDFTKFQKNWIERTAIIIFLNRTCFNGLFRVNSKGEFNVPFGDYKNPKICDATNLKAVSTLLQKAEIMCGDFTSSLNFIDRHTFVYFDPPYRPISKTASFTSYSKFDFNDETQKKLAYFYRLISQQDAKLMLSNSDPTNENPDDKFFENLFQGFTIKKVDASRIINCNSEKRGKIKELVIMNY